MAHSMWHTVAYVAHSMWHTVCGIYRIIFKWVSACILYYFRHLMFTFHLIFNTDSHLLTDIADHLRVAFHFILNSDAHLLTAPRCPPVDSPQMPTCWRSAWRRRSRPSPSPSSFAVAAARWLCPGRRTPSRAWSRHSRRGRGWWRSSSWRCWRGCRRRPASSPLCRRCPSAPSRCPGRRSTPAAGLYPTGGATG